MEKKTIGKFISALRKANGMTQKELGEKLFVSDKTVSRWECDECLPELSLIPSIAEIFGITTDELLRGERNNPDRESACADEDTVKQKSKSENQFKLMLEMRNRKYKNLTLISIGITVLGFISAIVVNLGFSKGLIAFCLATAFCVASELCQICFATNARVTPDDDGDYFLRIQEFNASVVKKATVVSFINLLLIVFCLPIVTLIDGANYGLHFDEWLGFGILFSAIALLIFYIIYELLIFKLLVKYNFVVLAEKQTEEKKRSNKLLKKTVLISASVAIGLGVCICIWYSVGWDAFLEKHTFDNCDDFKAFVENDYDNWFYEGYGRVSFDGVEVEMRPSDPDYPHKVVGHRKIYGSIQNSSGEEICVFCYNPDLYWRIEFTPQSDDKMPVTVITNQAVYDARIVYQSIESLLYALILIDFAAAAVIYLIKLKKNKKTA